VKLYSHLCCLENATEMNFSPGFCIGTLNNTGLGSKENVISYHTFPSSYVTSLVVTGGAFYHRLLLLIVVYYFFASFFETPAWYCDKDPVKIQMNYIHAIFLHLTDLSLCCKNLFTFDCASISSSDFCFFSSPL